MKNCVGLVLVIAGSLSGRLPFASAQQVAVAPKHDNGVLFEDDFSGEHLGKRWGMYKSSSVVRDGVMVGITPEDADHPSVNTIRIEPSGDLEVSVSFKFAGSNQFQVMYRDKKCKSSHAGHICHVVVRPNMLGLFDGKTGIFRRDIREKRKAKQPLDNATKELLETKTMRFPIELDPMQWHKLTIRIQGDRMQADIDGKTVGRLRSKGIAHATKDQVNLTTSKREVHYDDFKIRKLSPASKAAHAQHPLAAPGVTSLTNASVKYRVVDDHSVTLSRGDVTAILVDNAAIDRPDLPGHRAGYNGVASLTHLAQPKNLFVPSIAGLNFEHIHDGTTAGLREKFEPRKFPMQLRIIDEYTVELYQPPTGNWQLESCGRYRLLDDGTIECTFECIPRAGGYHHGYIGLFWASYIHQPNDKSIYFFGKRHDAGDSVQHIQAITPRHGVDSTHAPPGDPNLGQVDEDFPLTLVNHPSQYVCAEPWYYGVSHGMALVQMFRERDQIWIAQSPSGGGEGNPAWDFQWFIRDFQVGQAYGFQMRAAYLPFTSHNQIREATRHHRAALNSNQKTSSH